MHLRCLSRRGKAGQPQRYVQLMESYRRPDGLPTARVVAHLGVLDDVLLNNLRAALAASRSGVAVRPAPSASPTTASVAVRVDASLLYLPLEVVRSVFRDFGLPSILASLCPAPHAAASVAATVEALVAHRCCDPGSKLAFQRWIRGAAVEQVFAVDPDRLNNTRVHRVMDELAAVEERLQEALADRVLQRRVPRVLYLDLTDTWFVAGGGNLARRGQTKAGHRSQWKIHIALMVSDEGLPLRWRLLPGALSETTVLPDWLAALRDWKELERSVLVFDRGLPSLDNFLRLVGDGGHLFLTSVKSDAIATCLPFDPSAFDALQTLPSDSAAQEVARVCASLDLAPLDRRTFARDLGSVTPRVNPRRKTTAPTMRMYLYFNPEVQRHKQQRRAARIAEVERFVEGLNQELASAHKSRQPAATERKVMRQLEKHGLCEIYRVHLDRRVLDGKKTAIQSFRVRLELREDMLRLHRRYDGVTLLVGHPSLRLTLVEAVAAYRQKNAVEADFRTIKSVLNLRPTFHWTDSKIQAHVTLCILALLVERLIECRLDASRMRDLPASADALLAELSSIRLNRITLGDRDLSLRVVDSPRIQKLLRALGLENLLERYPPSACVPLPENAHAAS